MTQLLQEHAPTRNKAGNAGIYLHIPFCKQACVYCNFHFSVSLKNKKELLVAMVKELEIQKDYLEGATVSTIYFGGGTPSLLSSDEIKVLIETIYKNYTINDLAECTLEANPDDLSREYLRALKTTGIDRLSIGVQSFHENDLLYMKRAHTAQQADYCIKAAQDAGFTNLSIDLIYGTPGLTDSGWKENMAKLNELQIPHFSSYALTVEDKTALHHAILKKKSTPVDSNQAAAQFEMLMEFAAVNGYDHYEISNLAKPGMYAVHNTSYWLGNHYLGVGPSAHSFNGSSRKSNINNNALYTQSILKDGTIIDEVELLSPIQHLNEYIMTSLRTMWGCDLDIVAKKWGSDYANEIDKQTERLVNQGHINKDGRKIMLTSSGKLFADKIASDLFF